MTEPHRENDDVDDDDDLKLSDEAAAALKDFYAERDRMSSIETMLRQQHKDGESSTVDPQVNPRYLFGYGQTDVARPLLQISDFSENWQLSQFWYDADTADFIAQEAIQNCNFDGSGNLLCISTPTIFVELQKLRHPHNVLLMENDIRFRAFGDQFIYYDYRHPLDFNFASAAAETRWKSRNANSKADLIIVDPPFLSEECFRKTLETVNHFSHNQTKIILNTGFVMKGMALELLSAHICTFRPKHSSGLANEFRCYTNYQSDKMVWELESLMDVQEKAR